MRTIVLDQCDSTQDEVRQRLARARDEIVAVRARSQRAGRGRAGRMWDDPPGGALLLSIGTAQGLDISVLEELPRRVALLVGRELCSNAGLAPDAITWKPPNDLVVDGAKLGGVLIDARTSRRTVEELVIGIGANLDAAPFTTADGRAATSVRAVGGGPLDADELARTLVDEIGSWFTPVW